MYKEEEVEDDPDSGG